MPKPVYRNFRVYRSIKLTAVSERTLRRIEEVDALSQTVHPHEAHHHCHVTLARTYMDAGLNDPTPVIPSRKGVRLTR